MVLTQWNFLVVNFCNAIDQYPLETVQPFRRQAPSPLRLVDNLYKPLTEIKLPVFHGRYIENVNTWITIIEDRFFLHGTLENKKIADISALSEDNALVWYLDL